MLAMLIEVAKDDSSTFFHETLNDACAYTSSGASNDRDLICESEFSRKA